MINSNYKDIFYITYFYNNNNRNNKMSKISSMNMDSIISECIMK
jgi:hypothetical protein